jgi:hypothetical protein
MPAFEPLVPLVLIPVTVSVAPPPGRNGRFPLRRSGQVRASAGPFAHLLRRERAWARFTSTPAPDPSRWRLSPCGLRSARSPPCSESSIRSGSGHGSCKPLRRLSQSARERERAAEFADGWNGHPLRSVGANGERGSGIGCGEAAKNAEISEALGMRRGTRVNQVGELGSPPSEGLDRRRHTEQQTHSLVRGLLGVTPSHR